MDIRMSLAVGIMELEGTMPGVKLGALTWLWIPIRMWMVCILPSPMVRAM